MRRRHDFNRHDSCAAAAPGTVSEFGSTTFAPRRARKAGAQGSASQIPIGANNFDVGRLEALGARRVEKVRDWWGLEALTGQRFCVVHAAGHDFAIAANKWE